MKFYFLFLAVDRWSGALLVTSADLVARQAAKLPLWERDARLFVDRRHQGRQELIDLDIQRSYR